MSTRPTSGLLQRYWPLLLTLLIAALLLACFTLEKSERDAGYSQEAQLNPWLAAGHLLEKRGMRVRFSPHYNRLPAQADVIVLATPPDLLGQQEQAKLLAWVESGGHLIVEPSGVDNSDDPDEARELLRRWLEVRLQKNEGASDAGSRFLNIGQPGGSLDLRTVQMDKEGRLQAGFNPRFFLQAGRLVPAWSVSDENGTHAMRFQIGSGSITVLSDSQWIHNHMLERADHGALLWRVVNAKAQDEVWLIHGQDRPSLFAVLRENAAPLLLAVAIFVLAWLWQASRRFGPVHRLPTDNRRRLAEHLEASGRFLFRQDALDMLFNASRERLQKQIQRQHPQWRQLPLERQALHLAERSGIEKGAILRLLSEPAPTHILQFAADIRLINRLRKAP